MHYKQVESIMNKIILYLIIVVLTMSCTRKAQHVANSCCIEKTEKKIEIPIDSDTKIYTRAMHHFVDTTGVEYLIIENSDNDFGDNSLNFYRLDSCKLSHKIMLPKEGPNGIIAFSGHYMHNLDEIFITGFCHNTIYQINRLGKIIKKIDYNITTDKKEMITFFDANSLVYAPFVMIGSKIYGKLHPIKRNNVKGDDFKNFPINVTIDTCTNSVYASSLSFPRLWEKGEGISHNTHASRIYDGKQFVYAFLTQDSILVTADHVTSKSYIAKSKYIDEVYKEGFRSDISIAELNKLGDELPIYGNILYDKYRNVYYRFAYPPCKVDDNAPFEHLFSKKEFSIIILDANFRIIGETLFPADTYAPALFFINKHGLYLSENNIYNPNADENLLVFRCFSLAENTNPTELKK